MTTLFQIKGHPGRFQPADAASAVNFDLAGIAASVAGRGHNRWRAS